MTILYMNYGMPYKGSKNSIVPFLIDVFPRKKNFYDLFAGGCSVSHGVLLSGKFESIFINDISDYPKVFLKAINGDFKNEKRWISREDFFTLQDTEPYIRYCWSFGNNGVDYLYSKAIEPWKKALHYARVFNDFSLLEAFGIKTNKADRLTVVRNADGWKKKYIKWYCKEVLHFSLDALELRKNLEEIYGSQKLLQSLESLERLQRLQSLESLESLERLQSLQSLESLHRLQSLESLHRLQSLERLEISRKSYNEVEILPDSLIYCDIPYKNTSSYISGFDYEEFYKWCSSQKELVIISEYEMPDGFICIGEKEKRVNLSGGSSNTKIEKLFIPKHQKEMWGILQLKNKTSPFGTGSGHPPDKSGSHYGILTIPLLG